MGIKKYKPTTPSRRGMSVVTFDEITKKRPEKSLTLSLKRILPGTIKVAGLSPLAGEGTKGFIGSLTSRGTSLVCRLR